MDTETKALVRARSARAFPWLHDQLRYSDEYVGRELEEAYRFAYLILRGPRSFFDAFRHGELRLDADLVEEVWWGLRGQIPGPHGLMNEEMQILATHNEEVRLLYAKGQARQLYIVGATTTNERTEPCGPLHPRAF